MRSVWRGRRSSDQDSGKTRFLNPKPNRFRRKHCVVCTSTGPQAYQPSRQRPLTRARSTRCPQRLPKRDLLHFRHRRGLLYPSPHRIAVINVLTRQPLRNHRCCSLSLFPWLVLLQSPPSLCGS